MKVFGLFSGIGGFELALRRSGMHCIGLCEIDPFARKVLAARFPGVPLFDDVIRMKRLPECEILTAGFPCQDLSQAGPKVGIKGKRSRLVDHVFRLISTRRPPEWVIIENVSYMLRLQQGRAMAYILERLEDLGFNWAYRVIDARSIGLAQRRERVILIASRKHNPEEYLFPGGYISPQVDDRVGRVDMQSLYGFYWTEGKRGLGWTKDAVPTIKAGSSLGIASPPAIWNPTQDFFGTPDIRDAERLFGFPEDWTKPCEGFGTRKGARWKLVGNTICVPMVSWVGSQLKSPKGFRASATRIEAGSRPPLAGYGNRNGRYSVNVSSWCRDSATPRLATFLTKPLKPLSERATQGFYSRANESTTLRFADGFLGSIEKYLAAEAV